MLLDLGKEHKHVLFKNITCYYSIQKMYQLKLLLQDLKTLHVTIQSSIYKENYY